MTIYRTTDSVETSRAALSLAMLTSYYRRRSTRERAHMDRQIATHSSQDSVCGCGGEGETKESLNVPASWFYYGKPVLWVWKYLLRMRRQKIRAVNRFVRFENWSRTQNGILIRFLIALCYCRFFLMIILFNSNMKIKFLFFSKSLFFFFSSDISSLVNNEWPELWNRFHQSSENSH